MEALLAAAAAAQLLVCCHLRFCRRVLEYLGEVAGLEVATLAIALFYFCSSEHAEVFSMLSAGRLWKKRSKAQ